MRKLARAASIILFLALGGFFVWFGWTYASVKEPLWFHAAAIPEAARGAVRPIYFALMNLIGGASIGLGALGIFVSATMLRAGSISAASALAVAYATPLIYAAMTAESLAAETGAPTSWRLMGVLMAVTAVALASHVFSAQGNARPQTTDTSFR